MSKSNIYQIKPKLPYFLLILAGVFIFLTERRDGGAIEGSISDGTSAHGITISKNLMSSEHPLFMFSSKEFYEGDTVYEAYNRFPVFPFLLTGLVITPFEGNTNIQLYIARQLMNIFFFLSILIAFKLVDELKKNKFLALSVTIISFSSYYIFSFHNMIFNDTPALLGFIIALYCVVISTKKKIKTSHLLIYSILPISLGWQPYAVFGTWFLVDIVEVLIKKKISIRTKILNIFKSQSFQVNSIAAIWGVLVLGSQLLNEWRIVGGSFVELPSVSSGLWKSGLSSAEGHTSLLWAYDWFNYLPGQCRTIAGALVPFWPIFQIDFGFYASILLVVFLIVFTFFRYLNDKNSTNKILLIMVLSGFLWTIPMKNFVALHDFQSIFYIGFSLSIYTVLLSRINLQVWNFFAINITIIFIISISLTNYYKNPYSSNVITQFENIRNQLPTNSKVCFDGDRKHMKGFSRFALEFHLIDSFFTEINEAEYVISSNPNFEGKKLTANKNLNLFIITKN